MSSFSTTLSEKYNSCNENEAINFAIEYFNQSSKPFDDLLENLSQLSETNNNINLIDCLLHSFNQWKNSSHESSLSISKFNETLINKLILQTLPLTSLNDFI